MIEYLLEENKVLKEQFDATGKKLRLNNHQRRGLAKRGKALGWALLQEYATLVRPETILAWHRKLVALKYTAKRIFFTVEVWTMRGLVRYHVLFALHLAKREVQILHIGCQVNGQVVAQVARNLTDGIDGFLKDQRFFVCDHDPLFTKVFRRTLTDAGVEVIDSLRSGLRPIAARCPSPLRSVRRK